MMAESFRDRQKPSFASQLPGSAVNCLVLPKKTAFSSFTVCPLTLRCCDLISTFMTTKMPTKALLSQSVDGMSCLILAPGQGPS